MPTSEHAWNALLRVRLRTGALVSVEEVVRARVDANVFNFYRLPAAPRIETIDPLKLLSPNRLDVMGRYVFARQWAQGWGVGYGAQVYRHTLGSSRAGFVDGDGRKNGFADYLRQFSTLIDDVAINGYDRERGLVPYVGDSVVDASHRLATALYFRKPIDAVRLEGRPPITDATALLKSGMGSVVTEQLVTEYVRLDNDTFSATFFATRPSDYRQAMKLLDEKAHVIHSKQIPLSEKGRRNINRLLYAHEPWWNEELAERFVDLRFPRGGGINVAFFKVHVGEDPRPIKDHVRKAFKDTHWVHVNDTHEETVWVAEALLNPNGIEYLNLAPDNRPPTFDRLFRSYEAQIRESGKADCYCIDSGAVLAAFGLRDCNDIDYIVPDLALANLQGPDISSHFDEYANFPVSADDLIANPAFHFSWKGTKIMALHAVLLFKHLRASEKDLQDQVLILAAKRQPVPELSGEWANVTKSSMRFKRFRHSLGLDKQTLRRLIFRPVKRFAHSVEKRIRPRSARD